MSSSEVIPAVSAESEKQSGHTLLWKALQKFMGDDCPRMAAALAFYTVFSLPPLLVLLVLITSTFVEAGAIEQVLQGQIGGLLGPEGAAQVQSMIRNVERPGAGGPVATLLGSLAFLFGATASFAQLQGALNATWKVEPDPTRGDVKNYFLKRVLSFAMILAIGFLLMVSLVVSALLAAFNDLLTQLAPAGLSGPLLQAINTGIAFGVIALLFAAMFKTLPDAVVTWRDAAVGAVLTALLFAAGKFAIGLYLGRSDPGSVFGAAGSLAVVFLWIYYTSMILLFGAEFTWVWAESRGRPIQPQPGAVRVIWTKQRITPKVRRPTRPLLQRWRPRSKPEQGDDTAS
jgi:membrane protein